MKHLLALSGFLLYGFLLAQTSPPEVRSHSDYHPRTQELILKYQYYYDNWGEKEVKHGRYTEWSPKGTLKQESRYQNGKLDGLQVIYWPNGQIKMVTKFKNGIISGNREYYYRNGKLRKREAMAENVPNGISIWYNRQGEEKKRIEFAAGQKVAAP